MTKRISRDEVIGVWLRREFEGNWHRLKNLVSSYVPNLTKQTIKKIVDNPNYQDDKENNLRYMLLYSFRAPTLLAVWNASWFGKKLSENEFMELMVINFHGWNVLSDLTGKLSYVAERVCKEPRIHRFHHHVRPIVEGIHDIEQKGVPEKTLILLESNDSKFTTILEGNKSAVALYIKHYLKKETLYQPLEVHVGQLDMRSRWQW